MHRFVAAVLALALLAAGCGDDGDNEPAGPDVESDVAHEYLSDLDEAGLGDLFEDDEQAVAFVSTACANAATIGQTPEELIASGEVNEQSIVALEYCDTELGG